MTLVSPSDSAGNELRRALDLLSTATSLPDLYNALRTHARRLVGSQGIALILRDGDLCHYVEEDAIGPLWKGKKFPMAACISGWSMLKRQTVSIPDIRKDKRIPYDLYADTFVKSLVMTPVGKEPPVGALGAYWDQEYSASCGEIATVEILAHATGMALIRIRNDA